jgi:Protein of unknown function (DUF2726)
MQVGRRSTSDGLLAWVTPSPQFPLRFFALGPPAGRADWPSQSRGQRLLPPLAVAAKAVNSQPSGRGTPRHRVSFCLLTCSTPLVKSAFTPGKGIDHATCPKARVARSLWSSSERAFADVLMKAFQKKVNVFIKVRVLDVIELGDEPDKRRLFFWRDILGDKHFDYVICRRETLEPLLAVELDDPRVPRRSTTADDIKTTAARNAAFPLVRFSAASKLTPELVRQKLIAEYRLARAGPSPEEMGSRSVATDSPLGLCRRLLLQKPRNLRDSVVWICV